VFLINYLGVNLGIAGRVRERRTALGFTQLQLAENVGVAQNSIQKIESGDTKNPRNIEALARVLKCTPEYLRFGVGEMDNAAIEPDLTKSIPIIDYVQAGAWGDIEGVQETSEIDNAEHFVCPINCSDSSFALRVQGISMEPKFLDGDLIFVDPESESINGSYVVARLEDDNQATFKQLVIEGNQKFLKPLNKDWPDQLIQINANCTIVGRVIFTGKEL